MISNDIAYKNAVDRIFRIIDQKKITENKLARIINSSTSAISRIRTNAGTRFSRNSDLPRKICEYLGLNFERILAEEDLILAKEQLKMENEQFIKFNVSDMVTYGHMLDILNTIYVTKKITLNDFLTSVSIKGFRTTDKHSHIIYYYFIEDVPPIEERFAYFTDWRLFIYHGLELMAYVSAFRTELQYQMYVPDDFLHFLSQSYFESGGRAFDYISRKIIPWYQKGNLEFNDLWKKEAVEYELPKNCKNINLEEPVIYVNELCIYSSKITFKSILEIIEHQLVLETNDLCTLTWCVPLNRIDPLERTDWNAVANCLAQHGYSFSGAFDSVFDKPNQGIGKNNEIVYKLSNNVKPLTEICKTEIITKTIKPFNYKPKEI